MKKILLFLIFTVLFMGISVQIAEASFISDKIYRYEQSRIYKKEYKQIKKFFEVHNSFANKHDINSLKPLYSDNYLNNDGFNKEIYFKNVEETWEECPDITYKTKIISLNLNGDYASVNVEETAIGTVFETIETYAVAGEIHSKSTGIYHLKKINDKWLILGETVLTDESSLVYGDARFMNIDLESPSQVASGADYTTSVKVDADPNTFIIASIEHDPIKYPSQIPNGPLRAMPQSMILERILKANTDNLNEYTIASLAISKTKDLGFGDYKIYMTGLACIMKRVNVIPKNNFAKIEEKE
ncbi:hypothetical protein J6G99_05820 [bacterium]|nr:hypothetical protein [bacterium]